MAPREEHLMLDHLAPVFVLGLACAFLGWAVVVLTSRIERERRETRRERLPDPERGPLPEWVRNILSLFGRSWIISGHSRGMLATWFSSRS
jgi:hypothetical protein